MVKIWLFGSNVEISLLSVPRTEDFALPGIVEQTTLEPRRTSCKSSYMLIINTYGLLYFISDTFMFPNFIGVNKGTLRGC